jgi:hypothetical protein
MLLEDIAEVATRRRAIHQQTGDAAGGIYRQFALTLRSAEG